MKFNIEEDNAKLMRKLLNDKLPKEDEIIITSKGLIILDEEGPIRAEELGESMSDSIICGC